MYFFDGGGELPSHSDHHAFFRRTELAGNTATGGQYSQHFFLSPQDHPHPGTKAFHLDKLLHDLRETFPLFVVNDFGVVGLDQLHKIRRKGKRIGFHYPSAAMAERNFLSHDAGLFFEEIDASRVSSKKLHNLQHAQLQDFIEVERLVEGDGNVVQHIKFAVAAADFIFRPLHVRHIEQHALIAVNLAAGVARGKAAFDHVDFAAVFAPQQVLKISDITLLCDFAEEFLPVLRIHVQRCQDVQLQNFFFVGIAQHAYKSFVAVHDFAV